jgi:hypothetical protein
MEYPHAQLLLELVDQIMREVIISFDMTQPINSQLSGTSLPDTSA